MRFNSVHLGTILASLSIRPQKAILRQIILNDLLLVGWFLLLTHGSLIVFNQVLIHRQIVSIHEDIIDGGTGQRRRTRRKRGTYLIRRVRLHSRLDMSNRYLLYLCRAKAVLLLVGGALTEDRGVNRALWGLAVRCLHPGWIARLCLGRLRQWALLIPFYVHFPLQHPLF